MRSSTVAEDKTRTVITINGKLIAVASPISYHDLATLAGFPPPSVPSMTLRMARQRDQPQLEGRIVHPGESVTPVEGMIINVADTSNA